MKHTRLIPLFFFCITAAALEAKAEGYLEEDPAGQQACYELDRAQERTSSTIRRGSSKASVSERRIADDGTPVYDISLEYLLFVLIFGEQPGGFIVDIPSEYYTAKFFPRIRNEGPFIHDSFKLEYLGTQDAVTLDGVVYEDATYVHLYDIDTSRVIDAKLRLYELAAAEAKRLGIKVDKQAPPIQDLEIWAWVSPQVPALGGAKLNMRGRMYNVPMRVGFDYTEDASQCPPDNDEKSELTYFQNTKPIIDGRCTACHHSDGIAPFALTSYDEVSAHASEMIEAVASRHMPPWPAADECANYRNDRSLTTEQRTTLLAWLRGGRARGDPAHEAPPLPETEGSLSRVDLTLTMPAPYTPRLAPDEYRCFVLDWPASADPFITGFGAQPGTRSIVHHMVAYLVPPEGVAQVTALDEADSGPGYSCFGDAGVDTATWLGVWAPGVQDVDYPAGTGLRVEAGSKIVLQPHYHIHHINAETPSDQSSVLFRTADKVEKEAFLALWLNPEWLDDPSSMLIPAGEADVQHSHSADLAAIMTRTELVTIHGVFYHMHELGKYGGVSIARGDSGTKECLLDIPTWDFNWQLSYWLSEPRIVYPGDLVTIDCHWDNSRSNQPVVDGVRLPPRDVTWGNGTRDEMCLATLYVTEGTAGQ